ncbi:hypothetical protein FB451DRAFT_1366246 [Mycena latifolia]|nr:hypothetical protein FB451DRAFT_1366246 [Mycena latifolia]
MERLDNLHCLAAKQTHATRECREYSLPFALALITPSLAQFRPTSPTQPSTSSPPRRHNTTTSPGVARVPAICSASASASSVTHERIVLDDARSKVFAEHGAPVAPPAPHSRNAALWILDRILPGLRDVHPPSALGYLYCTPICIFETHAARTILTPPTQLADADADSSPRSNEHRTSAETHPSFFPLFYRPRMVNAPAI